MLSLDSARVIAERVALLSRPGAVFTARDHAEVTRMFTEKQSAAMESCMSLWSDVSRQYQKLFFESWTALFTGSYQRVAHAARTLPDASLSSTQRALKPYQRRASANARRLSR